MTPAQREFYEDYGRRQARNAPELSPAQVEAIARLLLLNPAREGADRG